ncbi:MAG: UvrD-helicase domain-containing protein [Acidimicrobiales bacterium]
MAVDPDRLLVGLDAAQREAVTTDAAPLCVLAGAGSGKTRVLTRRVAWRCATGRADARRVLVLTFTRAAARELGDRLRSLGLRDDVTAGTFHAVAWAQLRARHAAARSTPPTLLTRRQDLVRAVAADTPGRGGRRPVGAGPGRDGARAVRDIGAEIDWAKARLIGPDRYPAEAVRAGRASSEPAATPAADVYRRYETEKRRRGQVDFDDLLWRWIEVLEGGDDDATAQRWRFAHLFVDEFQDVNPLQFRLLEGWRGGRDDLCVVGDPNQAIYTWNGAAPDLIERFAELYPGGSVVAVDRGYRSSPQIVGTANAVLDAAGAGGVRNVAVRADGAVPTIVTYTTGAEEAAGVARSVVDAHGPGTSWRAQAVLARTNALLGPVASALAAAGVPHRVRGRTPLGDHPAVRAWCGRQRRGGHDLTTALALLATAVAEPDRSRLDDGDRDALVALLATADEYARSGGHVTLHGLVAWMAAAGEAQESRTDGVELVTFHAAKGLEWPVVHVIALEDGTVPIAHARTAAAVAEERRLLYVALTRAERALSLSWARQRATTGGRTARRRPSPFLVEIVPTLDAQRVATEPVDPRAGLDAARRALAQTTGVVAAPLPATEALGEDPAETAARHALEAWRARTARRAGLPPGAVLADRALHALAVARPTSSDALRAVPDVGIVLAAEWGSDLLAAIHADPDATGGRGASAPRPWSPG